MAWSVTILKATPNGTQSERLEQGFKTKAQAINYMREIGYRVVMNGSKGIPTVMNYCTGANAISALIDC